MSEQIASVPPPAFDLSELADMARKASPEIAQQVDSELGSQTPPANENTATAEEAVESVNQEIETQNEPATEEKTDEVLVEDKPLDEALTELNKTKSDEAPAAKEETDKIVAAESNKKRAEIQVPNERDKDLQLDEVTTKVMRPSTKKLIEERNAKIVVERNKAETLAKEKADLEAQLLKAKSVVVPKEVEEELKLLREKTREFDILQDPSFIREYVTPIQENSDKIIEKLKEYGFGETTDGRPDPDAIEAIKKTGLTVNTLAPHIKKLESAGELGAAEELREYARRNRDLLEKKNSVISGWKTDSEGKRRMLDQQTQQQQMQAMETVKNHATKFLTEDLATLSKDFPFINRPAEPLPTDSPAIAKAKNDSIAAYDAAAKAVEASISQLESSKVTPDKVAEVQGRVSASAVQGVILRHHVLPRLAKDLAELRARNAELESKVGKIKTAGSLSRAHAAAASSPAGAKAALPESTEDAAKQIAKEMGISLE